MQQVGPCVIVADKDQSPNIFHVATNIPSSFHLLHSLKLIMASEGGSVFDVGPASGLGPTPEVRPATEGEPTSTSGPQAEFHVTDRLTLLNTLKDTLKGNVPSTVWACLWLSDIDKLKELVGDAKQSPFAVAASFQFIEHRAKIVQLCSSIAFHVFLQYRSANII